MPGQNTFRSAQISRRRFCARALTGTAAGIFTTALQSVGQQVSEGEKDQGFVTKELRAMEGTAAAFMEKYHVPGMSVAIAKEGRLVYARGFGLANKETGEK